MKKLNTIIKNHTSYIKDESRVKNQIDFDKYGNHKKRFSLKKGAVLGFVVSLLLVGIGVIIGNSISSSKWATYSIEQRKEMSKVVYNSATVNNEEYIPYKINLNKLTGKRPNNVHFYYTDLKVKDSFLFKVEMNCSLQPFFTEDLTGKTVDIIIANLELKATVNPTSNRLKTSEIRMIVINYKREIAGFLTVSQYSYHDFDYDENNCDYTDPDLNHFGSYIFLTDNARVKYYERGEVTYDLFVDSRDRNNIIFSSITVLPTNDGSWKDVDNGSVSMLTESYQELSSDYTQLLIDQCLVKEIETFAKALYIEDTKLYVKSDKNPTLKSITLVPNGIVLVNGKEHTKAGLTINEGDTIYFSYFQRYQGYNPVDIYVTYINIIR